MTNTVLTNAENVVFPPNIEVQVEEEKDPNLSLCEMIDDTSKAGQLTLEPLAQVMACAGSAGCCVLMFCLQAKDNSEPATRHDVIHRDEIKEREGRDRENASDLGNIVGACLPRTAGRLIGGGLGLFTAPVRLVTGQNNREDGTCCYTREQLDEAPSVCGGTPSLCSD